MPTESLYSIYALAHTDESSLPFNNRGRTMRVVVVPNIEAEALAVRFANYHGRSRLPIGAASLALCDKNGVLRPETLVPLSVGGERCFALEAGETQLSDLVPFTLRPGDYLALSLYYPSEVRVTSGNRIDSLTLRSRAGNYCLDPSLPTPGLLTRLSRTAMASGATLQITSVCEILAKSPGPHRVLACFGDSITQHGNWTVPLRKRLTCRYPGEISLCNLGIGGNRLLKGPPEETRGLYGLAGIERFERDILGLQGLRYVIIAMGINDIGLPGWGDTPESDLPELAQYFSAMESLANRLHQRGVKVYATTLMPRPLEGPYYDEMREAMRLAANDWIRTAPCMDAVIDFDAVLRRLDSVRGIKDGYALPDGVHPSPYGGLWMAKAVNLTLFGGEPD